MTTTTDLAVRDDSTALETYTPPAAGTAVARSLADWETELVAAGSLAQKLCITPFVPTHFRNKPADAAAAILTGFELGLSPLASLRSIFMISGTPGMYAKTMVAVVQAQGHHVWVEEQSKDRVIVCGRRKDWPADIPDARTVWDHKRAETAELLSNTQYRKNPQQMFTARGQAEICRQVAPDALLGIPYSVEELEDMPPARAEVVNRAPVTSEEILALGASVGAPQSTVDAVAPTSPAPAMTLADRVAKAITVYAAQDIDQAALETRVGRPAAGWGDEDVAALSVLYQSLQRGETTRNEAFPPAADADTPMAAKQRNRMFALFTEVGIADEDEQRAYMSRVLERDVESRGAITALEATAVIAALESDGDR